MQFKRRAGFSLIEALVVLAIGGMALAVIFSIGLKAGDSGFSLGRKAMAASDLDIVHNDIRTVLRSFELRPLENFTIDSDVPLTGTATSLEGQVVLSRSTPCAPRGWAGRARISVISTPEGHELICNMGGEAHSLYKWAGGTQSAFSFSRDGETWYDHIPQAPTVAPEAPFPPSHTVWIRFTTSQGLTIIDRVTSGRFERWRRPDVAI